MGLALATKALRDFAWLCVFVAKIHGIRTSPHQPEIGAVFANFRTEFVSFNFNKIQLT
jgi:hypothetical protein